LTFTHNDKTYKVGPIDQGMKARLEQWLRQEAYEDLYRLRGVMPPDQYRDALAAITADRARYVYLGEVFQRTISTPAGGIGFVATLLGCHRGEAETLLAERGADIAALIQEAVIQSLPAEAAVEVRKQLASQGQSGAAPANPTPPA